MQYKFCPKCGGTLDNIKCTKCGFAFYQNSKPTATAVLIEDGKVLMTKRNAEPRKDTWNLPGGFLESGEDPIEGLRREIREELGVEIEVKDFLGFFMDKYDFADITYDTLNLAWICTVASGTLKAADDAAAIEWFPLNNLPDLSFKCDKEILDAAR